ncbi:protein of unknown function [Streptococcus thermophilus]|nr:protein of unknown function [Streptococcus thermophilus]
MRKLIGIKYWVNQCTVGSDDSHNSEVGLCPTIFQEENSKHGHTAMVKGQTNKKRKALPEVPGVKGKELNGLNSDKGPTPYIIVMPKPTQVTQEYHRQEHKQIIGQRYMGGMSWGHCQKILHSLLLMKLLCLLLYQISG